MANTQQTQVFYALTLEQPSAVTAAVACNAIPNTKLNEQQILEARGSRLLLHTISTPGDQDDRLITTIAEHDCFSIIRGVSAFRIPGTPADQLVVSTDSGRIAVLEYDEKKQDFKRLALESFGKSGVRRTVPGQYIASDPRGRCVMLASVEKNKIVYFFNRSSEGKVVISSPHEANQWGTLCFNLIAIDPGWEQPTFAAIEIDYTSADRDPSGEAYENREKQLVYYTVDLGLNHVVKSWSEAIDYTANMLFAVPGGEDGPSGVLVCAEDRIYYRHDKGAPHTIAIPRRKGVTEDANHKRHIVCGCMHINRKRHDFFFLLQTEDGDTFKLTIDVDTDEEGRPVSDVQFLTMKYYDTFPVARQMILHRKGYLYVAAENGQNKLYHIDNLGDDPEFESENTFTSHEFSPDHNEPYEPTYFQPRELSLTHLQTDLPGLHPLLKAKIDNPLNEDAPQIYTVQGTGNRSQFKTIRHGLDIDLVVETSLGTVPYDNIWTFKHRRSDDFHKYLVVSSTWGNVTVVCDISSDDVEQIEDSGFLTNLATVHTQLIGDSTLVQVHARGIRMLLETGQVIEWNTPAHRTVVSAAANDNQLLLALSSAELVFFVVGVGGVLHSLEDMPEMSGKITAMGVAPTPKGRLQGRFAVVGCDDCTIRVLSIESETPLELQGVQALSAIPRSIEVIEMLDATTNSMVNVVHIGLESGVYLRAVIDETTGELGDVRTKFLGTRPPRFFPVHVEDQNCVVGCSNRPYLGYNHPQTGIYTTTPLLSQPFDAVRPFISSEVRNGICAIQGSSLSIFQIPSIEGRFSHSSVSLNYTPRGMARHPELPLWYIVQSEGNTLPKSMRDQLRANTSGDDHIKNKVKTEIKTEENGDSTNGVTGDEALTLEKHLGLPHYQKYWASCVQVVDPVYHQTILSTIELEDNEAALSCAVVTFESRNWEPYLAVGTGQHLSPGSDTRSTGFVHMYRIIEEGTKLELVHKTSFDAPIYAMMQFRGRLALGVANELFIYDMGIKSLLRKSRGTAVAHQIVSLDNQGNRIAAGDISDGVTYLIYKPRQNRLIPFVDDSVNRWTTTATILDYDTLAGGDKFGNLWVVRCPPKASAEADDAADDSNAVGYLMNERSYLHGAPYRLELRAHYFTQDIPTAVQKTPLVAGGQDVLFWAGLQGTLGLIVPFVTRDDVDFFTRLELAMRAEDPPLTGRDHLAYRSYYAPVKGVIDGDLCERFMRLGYDGKQKIAAELEREVKEVEKKVQEMRSRVAY